MLRLGNPPSADTGNSANFYLSGNTTGNLSYRLTDAGAYALSGSPYGTFDQGGNVWESTETLIDGCCRIARAGGWSTNSIYLRASSWDGGNSTNEYENQGFRVASAAVPEPGSAGLIVLGIILAIAKLNRRRAI